MSWDSLDICNDRIGRISIVRKRLIPAETAIARGLRIRKIASARVTTMDKKASMAGGEGSALRESPTLAPPVTSSRPETVPILLPSHVISANGRKKQSSATPADAQDECFSVVSFIFCLVNNQYLKSALSLYGRSTGCQRDFLLTHPLIIFVQRPCGLYGRMKIRPFGASAGGEMLGSTGLTSHLAAPGGVLPAPYPRGHDIATSVSTSRSRNLRRSDSFRPLISIRSSRRIGTARRTSARMAGSIPESLR